MQLACKRIIKDLKKQALPIRNSDDLKSIGTISANGETEIGKIISETIEKVGKDGTITITGGTKLTHEVSIVKGLQIDQGYISPYFMTDPEAQKCVFKNPLILLTD